MTARCRLPVRCIYSWRADFLPSERFICCRLGERAAEIAKPCLQFLTSYGIQAEQHLSTNSSQPAEQILQFAERLNAGMLVMGAYGQP